MTNKKLVVSDVDGVLTTGHFLYNEEGKAFKIFGAHDNDGVKLLKENGFEVKFVTADKRGFEISKRRIKDMRCDVELHLEANRYYNLKNKYGLENIIYIGDGYHDAPILKDCLFGIAPKNARIEAKESADFITQSNSGEGAFLDAALKIISVKELLEIL